MICVINMIFYEGGGESATAAAQNDFASTLAETLSSLSANAESLKVWSFKHRSHTFI